MPRLPFLALLAFFHLLLSISSMVWHGLPVLHVLRKVCMMGPVALAEISLVALLTFIYEDADFGGTLTNNKIL